MSPADPGRDPRSGPGDQRTRDRLVDHATCLGCGCACDDIAVVVHGGRITDTRNACTRGAAWFGDGTVPNATRVDGRAAAIDAALDGIAALIARAEMPLIYLAPELSCEAQRAAIALADRWRASLDTVTTHTAGASIVAAQERGRAGATLGEIRHRADVVVFWGVDPGDRYPRYWTRYAPAAAAMHASTRTVIAVDIGDQRGPADATLRVAVPAREEVATLTALDAIVRQPATPIDGEPWTRARALAERLTAAKYVAIVADAEPPAPAADRMRLNLSRATALIAVAQGLNGPTRCALSTLRGGGNRSGADNVLTSQTGYPMAVSFAEGFPTYRPFDAHTGADAVLIIGDASQVPPAVMSMWPGAAIATIGPRASECAAARIAIDTGLAGIHHGGTAVRMDDVPLPLRPSIDGFRDPVDLLRQLLFRSDGGADHARRTA
jgi:formylmethanofuran dehydrogenase subunit B